MGGLDRRVVAGQSIDLNGVAYDPDGDTLAYKWWRYADADTHPDTGTIDVAATKDTSYTVPANAKPGETIHLIFQVSDAPSRTTYTGLKVYKRLVLTVVSAVDQTAPVGGTVPATLSLTLGAPATFGAFTPGVAKTYSASTTATVISTAGDATLSVADPSSSNPGRLVNGSFALASPLGGLGVVKTWSGPVSNEKVTVPFTQAISATEPLRTGTYSKTLTFTLSTTNP
jgi:hypothetical protein